MLKCERIFVNDSVVFAQQSFVFVTWPMRFNHYCYNQA